MSETIMWDKKGVIFNIQRFSLHDGPGIRTIVFLKGCPLRCKWCCNPESQNIEKQIMFVKSNCIECFRCLEVCPTGAIQLIKEKKLFKEKCIACGKCVEVCQANAMQMVGKEISVKEVLEEIKKDEIYYKYSNGGLTLSGGEALFQPEFAVELLKACKSYGFNTSIETTAFVSTDVIKQVIPFVDLVLLDLKMMNSELHKEYTGQNNEIIMKNAQYIASMGKQLIIRIPVIPEINDTYENVADTILFIKQLENVNEVHILPYHRLGVNKYDYLGYKYALGDKSISDGEKIKRLQAMVESNGLICKIGG